MSGWWAADSSTDTSNFHVVTHTIIASQTARPKSVQGYLPECDRMFSSVEASKQHAMNIRAPSCTHRRSATTNQGSLSLCLSPETLMIPASQKPYVSPPTDARMWKQFVMASWYHLRKEETETEEQTDIRHQHL